jgi:hypothetical protein
MDENLAQLFLWFSIKSIAVRDEIIPQIVILYEKTPRYFKITVRLIFIKGVYLSD